MEIINILSDFLANNISISTPAARGLFKLAIKDEMGPFKPLNQIDFWDLKKVIYNSLKERLIKLDIKNIDLLMSELNKQLIEKQSLISMLEI